MELLTNEKDPNTELVRAKVFTESFQTSATVVIPSKTNEFEDANRLFHLIAWYNHQQW